MQIAQDRRIEYAQKLRWLADEVEKSGDQPAAIRVFLFFQGVPDVIETGCTEPGANHLLISGALLKAATCECMSTEHEDRSDELPPPPSR